MKPEPPDLYRSLCQLLRDLPGARKMTSNPKHSPWRSTPRAKRSRRGIQLTLSDEAVAALNEMAGEGKRSEFVEALILEAWRRR